MYSDKQSDTRRGTLENIPPLRFGTSGLRALVEEMTDMECYINTRGFIYFLMDAGSLKEGDPVAIAGDRRESTGRIMSCVARAIGDTGCKAVNCGKIPSPALCYYAMTKGMPSVMVTGSHVPADRNGIKFTKKTGEVLKSDEKAILEGVSRAREEEYSLSWEESLFGHDLMFKVPQDMPEVSPDAAAGYIERYTSIFSPDTLKAPDSGDPVKIVLYEHSAVGRDLVREILTALGADVVAIGRSEEFVPVDTEKISDTSSVTKGMLASWAAEHSPFAIISTDGDSDRPLVADGEGNFIPGDKLGALTALYLGPDIVALPVSANDGVAELLRDRGMKVVLTKIGSPYVIRAMQEELSKSGGAKKAAAWEANGGFLTGSEWILNDKVLEALPTRDAVLPVICSLSIALKERASLKDAASKLLPARETFADVIDTSTTDEKGEAVIPEYNALTGKELIRSFSPSDDSVISAFFDEERPFVKYSDGRDAPAGGDMKRDILKIKNDLQELYGREGLGGIVGINWLDGIKITFAGGEVSHLRPSGNAPEFRNYAQAQTARRAYEIVESRKRVVPALLEMSARSGSDRGNSGQQDDIEEMIALIAEGQTPIYISPYLQKKVWGIGGIGEYWYGAEKGEKTSTANIDGMSCGMDLLFERVPEALIGRKVLDRFGRLFPLTKILTPGKRLSVQFHDSKNELWVVTDMETGGPSDEAELILGFSPASVDRYAEGINEAYKEALTEYAQALNSLIDELEERGYSDVMKSCGDVREAALKVSREDNDISGKLEEFSSYEMALDFFYNKRSVRVGDVIPVPSGTLHALGAGIEVLEPQIPGPTQSMEDGATYPVRYAFPGYERPSASKTLDVDRVSEIRPGVTKEETPRIIDEDPGIRIERLPGGFEKKGMEVRSLSLEKGARYTVGKNQAGHLLAIADRQGEAAVIVGNKEYNINRAQAGKPLIFIPASIRSYTIKAVEPCRIIDTFSPV